MDRSHTERSHMSDVRLLSLFTGYGGLDHAVETLTGATTVAVSDIDPGACEVLRKRRQGVPNLGDVTALDMDDLPDFDILTGGYPCQPFSLAGRRGGENDPRHLWPVVRRIIAARRPSQVFLENVRGHLSLGFAEVVRDLVEVGYRVDWSILAASSVGAPHRRERLYIYATPLPVAPSWSDLRAYDDYVATLPRTATGRVKFPTAGTCEAGDVTVRSRVDEAVRRTGDILLPTPTASDGDRERNNPSQARRNSPPLSALPLLLPTPVARDYKGSSSPSREGGPSLGGVHALLPTPSASDGTGGGQDPEHRRAGGHTVQLPDAVLGTFGKYAPAVKRWEHVTGRPAPAPTELNRNGKPRLTAELPEWMMGLPTGWLTGEDLELTRSR